MNRWVNAWRYLCPRCRQSPLFIEPFELSKPLDMPSACRTCGQRYEPEPGFYFGAMFVSYLLSSLILLPIALLLNFFTDISVNAIIGWVIFLGAILFIRILRLSRSVWIHIMVRYDPMAVDKYESKRIKQT